MWPSIGYRRVHDEAAPAIMAQHLKQAGIHAKAARRIDDFERVAAQHHEHRKAQLKIALGAVGLVLGTAPGVPGAYASCREGLGVECSLRLGAMLGAVVALGVAVWGAWDLCAHPVKIRHQAHKLSEEIARSMRARTGDATVQNLFGEYLTYTPSQRAKLKEALHEAAEKPKRGHQLWRQAGEALGL